MSEKTERPRLREHLQEVGRALGGIGKDLEIDAAHAPRLAKEETKNVLAKAAGVKRGPLRSWNESEPSNEP